MTQRIALITGASRGLGRNIATHLAARGTDAILTYQHNADAAADTVDALRALGWQAIALPLDVADSRAFPAFAGRVRAALAATWQRERFDILVNNAGSGLHAAYLDTTEEQFDSMIAIHLKSAFFLTQALLPLMADGGRILNVSSGLARFSIAGASAYALAKGGVEVLTRYQARELAQRRITVNVLAPGAIETDFNGGMVRDNAQLNAFVTSQTALGRAGLPDDIGAAAAALLDEGNGWMTGQRVEVSGGMWL
ncbi:SDR family NAD(P)-dependent oxidoreductase [Telluria aromaticivorans]|uniref:SDR family oxidoreductase n=1 Tax=Telluria aromaticivorans TaxID=2725995 RepID=A0A7Y2K3V3_9BURK|nr:SDR family oxidoreductase [Telluria aromaticivorans]NNG25728.1 SDR family oxidoreductase [Telluria aromaticivorans]